MMTYIIIIIIIFLVFGYIKLSIENETIKHEMYKDNQSHGRLVQWWQDYHAKMFEKVPTLCCYEGVGLEKQVIKRKLLGFPSLEMGDLILSSSNKSYIITQFIGIINDEVSFRVELFKNDNIELL